MPYEPLRSELTAEEQHFLDLVAPIGIDWITTRQDLAGRFGISRYCDCDDVVALPPSNALSDAPLEWRMYADPAVMDLPPEYLFAEFMPHAKARNNHRDIEAQLRVRLGEPAIADASNCLVREWKFGVFTVRIHTFPPELQDKALARNNMRYRYDARLAIASSISITSDFAHAYPDGSLGPLAALVQAAGRGGDAQSVFIFTSAQQRGARVWLRPSRRHSRRNPQSLTRVLPPSQPVAWIDPAGWIGLSVPLESLVFERTPDCHLVLVRIEPGRAGGASSLELAERGKRTPVFEGDEMNSLDVVAHLMSGFWGLPLAHETSAGD